MRNVQHIKNESLKVIKERWEGNRFVNGRFRNLHHNTKHGVMSVLRWRFSYNPQRREKRRERWNPLPLYIHSLEHIEDNSLIWLGHNSFYMQMCGKRIIFDPVFANIPFVKRKSRLPIKPHLFENIDYILLSHDHYDHLDKRSLKLLLDKNPHAKVICGLNLGTLIRRWSKNATIIEAGWYQQIEEGELKITFMPCQHWSKRSALDAGKRLWGAYMVQSDNYTLYYSGDTGNGRHFKELPKLFGRIDCAIMGIGAYKPRWFMHASHISPYEALDGAAEMGAHLTVPMHYGTFSLSDEPMSDPPTVFENEAKRRDINIYIPLLGEVLPLIRDNNAEV